MKIAILGYDTEGRVSYDYFAAQDEGHELTICDQKTDLKVPDGATRVLGDGYLDNLDRFDLIVRTAGLPPQLIINKNPGIDNKITTHINEFFKASPTKNIIGVTGTKGKGTTSTLITKMLEASGKTVYLGGNIGIPPLTFLADLDESSWVVLELSSFQLIDLRTSPHIGVCLMVVPEHLNWHADMPDYIAAKSRLFMYQNPSDVAIYFAENELSKQIAQNGQGQKIPFYAAPGAHLEDGKIIIDGNVICETEELKLLGQHNWQNVCAAVTAVWHVDAVTQEVVTIHSVLTDFSGLEHRLEFVREVNDVRYYDDSFGTTPETAIVALKAFTEPKVLILGGSDKGADYDELAQAVAVANIRQVFLIGEQAGRLQQALEQAGFQSFLPGGETMSEIVTKVQDVAERGDVVLLSPGCASFDMFADYKDRASQFVTAVRSLPEAAQ